MPLLPAGSTRVGPAYNLAEKVQRDLLAAVITAKSPISRTSYAAATGVSLPTVQRAANSLLAAGFIVQGEDLPLSQRGRPERALQINPRHVYIGLAIEDRSPVAGKNVGWQVSAAGVTLDGELFGGMTAVREHIEQPNSLSEVLEAARKAVAQVRGKVEERGARVHGLGVSVGGHVQDGTVRFSPNIRGLDGQPLGELMEDATGLPVLVENDVNALARRLLWQKGGREMNFTVVLLKPDGIGSGTVKGDDVYFGSTGMSGELGHFKMYPPSELLRQCRCGGTGCLETIATPQAIAHRLGVPEVEWRTTIDRAEGGDPDAEKAFSEAGDFLGRALGQLVNIVDPERIYLLGDNELLDPERHRAAALYFQAAKDTLLRDVFPTAQLRFSEEGVRDLHMDTADLPTEDEQASAAAVVNIQRLVENQPEDKTGGA
ncbi:ROK family protein [Streptomyces sp. NPDC002587]